MPETRRVLIAWLPFDEKAEEIENALKEWIKNPSNMSQFADASVVHWSVAVSAVSIDGMDKYGHKIKIIGNNGIIFSGTIDPVKDM